MLSKPNDQYTIIDVLNFLLRIEMITTDTSRNLDQKQTHTIRRNFKSTRDTLTRF